MHNVIYIYNIYRYYYKSVYPIDIHIFPVGCSLFPIDGAGPGPAPPRVRGPRGRPSGGPGGTPTVRPCREGPADWDLDWGGDTSGYYTKPRMTIQSPKRLYKAPTDNTKHPKIFMYEAPADPIKPQNIIQRGKNIILLICFMIHKLEVFKNNHQIWQTTHSCQRK